ncbi:LCP family protein, partial [Pseudomonadota bacterium]
VSFRAGNQLMDGATALKYARSRKSTSDFDRAKRQQKIISAVRNKALEIDLIGQLHLSTKIYALLKDEVQTDMSLFDALGYLNECKGYNISRNNVIDTSNYLSSTRNTKGNYVLVPKRGNYNDIREYVANLLN